MWNEIYNFFEQYAGVSYSFVEDIMNISGELIFIEPYAWQSGINIILQNLEDAMDVIDQYGDEINDEYIPNKIEMKKIVGTYVLDQLILNLNSIKRTLNVEIVDISSYEELEHHLYLIGKLVEMFVETSFDDLLGKNVFDTYITETDEDDNEFVTVLGLHRNDVTNLSFVITSIRDEYFASLDDEE